MTCLAKGSSWYLALKFHELSSSEESFGRLCVVAARTYLQRLKERTKERWHFTGIYLTSPEEVGLRGAAGGREGGSV